jgi:GxxExxY protein
MDNGPIRLHTGRLKLLRTSNSYLIIDVKFVEALASVQKQLLTYLRLTDLRLGLLINFNVELIKDGIQRVVNRLSE